MDPAAQQVSDQVKAMEHLRVIRSLMEKRTVYRAISAPGALMLGLLSMGMGFYCAFFSPQYLNRPISYVEFIVFWAGVFLVAGIYNFWLLHRESERQGWVSQQMKMALQSLFPALLLGALASGLIGFVVPLWSAITWILFYGLALHSMWSFAPRSIQRLAWLFLASGVFLILYAGWHFNPQSTMEFRGVQHASVIMGLVFGGLHLFYGLMVYLRKTEYQSTEEPFFNPSSSEVESAPDEGGTCQPND